MAITDVQKEILNNQCPGNKGANLGDIIQELQSVPGGLVYKGTWDADTNDPTLSSSGGGGVGGDYYIVSVDGSTDIDGITDWKIGDWIINNGSNWQKIDNTQTDAYTKAETDALLDVDARVAATAIKDVVNLLNADINGLTASSNDRVWYLPSLGSWAFRNPAGDEGLTLSSRENDGTFAEWLRGEIAFYLKMFDADRVELSADSADLVLLVAAAKSLKLTTAANQLAGFHGSAVIQATHIADASGGGGNVDTIVNAILVALETKGILANS